MFVSDINKRVEHVKSNPESEEYIQLMAYNNIQKYWTRDAMPNIFDIESAIREWSKTLASNCFIMFSQTPKNEYVSSNLNPAWYTESRVGLENSQFSVLTVLIMFQTDLTADTVGPEVYNLFVKYWNQEIDFIHMWEILITQYWDHKKLTNMLMTDEKYWSITNTKWEYSDTYAEMFREVKNAYLKALKDKKVCPWTAFTARWSELLWTKTYGCPFFKYFSEYTPLFQHYISKLDVYKDLHW